MRIGKRFLFSSLVLAALAIGVSVAVFARADEYNGQATAVLQNANGDEVGHATFAQDEGRVEVQVEVHDLQPGFHGFHVHTIGNCTPPTFSSAGGHLGSLSGQTHPHHAGDLPVLLVNEDGTGEATVVTDRFTIADLTQPGGTALIVHALPDNFGNIPVRYNVTFNVNNPDSTTLKTGDSGARIACGVIQPENSDEESANIVTTGLLQVLRTFFDSAKTLSRIPTFNSPSLPSQ